MKKNVEKQGVRKRFMKAACVGLAGFMCVAPMAGCAGIQNLLSGQAGTARGSVNTLATLSQRSFKLEKNAVNEMCNGALKLTYLDMQRRPMSTFTGAELASAGMSGIESSGSVSEFQTNDIVIQIDISFTWNVNTYLDTTGMVLGASASTPETLGDILQPGSLMYIEGVDEHGEQYLSADIVAVQSTYDNPLATSSSWNYNILSTPLPETSVTSQGSFLMRVASTAKDLKLNIITPVGGQDVTDDDMIFMRSVDVYVLELT